MTGILNASTGIDAGSVSSKLAYADNLGTRIIAEAEGFDVLRLREEAEIFFDEPVFSCVIAVSEGLGSRRVDALKNSAMTAGFREIELMTSGEAMSLGLGNGARTLVYDFGASGSNFAVIEGGEILERVTGDVSGGMFDKIFAEYLCERRLLKKIDSHLLSEARRIKHILSESKSRLWHNVEIFREDFERLIYFPVKRSLLTFKRLKRVWKPERFVLTGGCVKIPLVQEFFEGAEIIDGLIVKGAALKALELTRRNRHEILKAVTDNSSKIRELRAEILGIEEGLTRRQKDKLYIMFRQAENANDAGILAIIGNMIREIQNA
ncbi:MAG: hypothetical protein IJ697_04470 [Synergistaceae bacterium]|nr:hypothetical protein [Synergistaceae bacterium]